MKTKLDIRKAMNGINSYSCCYKCSKGIMDESHYVEYGMKYAKMKFHLTCFNKMEQKELKKADLCYNNINIDLKHIADFKKRVIMVKFKPMDVNNTIKKVGSFKMMIDNRFYNNHVCDQCNQRIDKGDICINYGASIIKNYHLICFQEVEKKRLNKWKIYKGEVQNNLQKLEPYKNEMICEGLEGVGVK